MFDTLCHLTALSFSTAASHCEAACSAVTRSPCASCEIMLREASILSEFPKYSIRKFSMACGSAATRKMFDRRIFHGGFNF